MPTTTLNLPFLRTMKVDPRKAGVARSHVHVVDVLPVRLPTYGTGNPGFLAVERGESGTVGVRLAAGGKAYEGYLREWTGFDPEAAANRLQDAFRRRHDIYKRIPAEAVLDDGRARQRAELAEFERDTVLVGDRLYARDPVPEVALVLDGGHVAVRTLRAGETRPPSWMRFPLHRRDEALDMARALAEGLPAVDPALDWRRRHGTPVDTMEFTSWSVKDPDGIAGLPLAEGGNGARFERLWAFSDDLVALATPSVGHFPNDVLHAFADLRTRTGSGDDADEALESLARGLLDHGRPARLDADTHLSLRVAAHCVLARIEGHELRYGASRAP